MANLRQVFHDIAESIRSKGITGTMKPIEMADRIGEIKITDYLIFTAEEDITLTLVQNGNITSHKLLKSTDGVNWTKWENPSTNGISLKAGDSVYIKDDEDALNRTATSDSDYNSYSSTGRIKCNGSLMPEISLKPVSADYSYFVSSLFRDCTKLTKAPELPATTLANNCYGYMFWNCTSLTQAPELPATTLANNCYSYMFGSCTSLTTAPELPATTLANNCYKGMFGNCSSLTQVRELPATTLTEGCYAFMFYGCTSLTTVPELTTSNGGILYCFSNMFQGCTSLKRIKISLSNGGGLDAFMFSGCTSLELVDMTGSDFFQIEKDAFENTNDTFKVVVKDELFNDVSYPPGYPEILDHMMKQSDWNAAHPDDQL